MLHTCRQIVPGLASWKRGVSSSLPFEAAIARCKLRRLDLDLACSRARGEPLSCVEGCRTSLHGSRNELFQDPKRLQAALPSLS